MSDKICRKKKRKFKNDNLLKMEKYLGKHGYDNE